MSLNVDKSERKKPTYFATVPPQEILPIVNGRYQSSVKGIYVIGDVTGSPLVKVPSLASTLWKPLLLVQRTVSPALMVRLDGEKMAPDKVTSWMTPLVVSPPGGGSFSSSYCPNAGKTTSTTHTKTARPKRKLRMEPSPAAIAAFGVGAG